MDIWKPHSPHECEHSGVKHAWCSLETLIAIWPEESVLIGIWFIKIILVQQRNVAKCKLNMDTKSGLSICMKCTVNILKVLISVCQQPPWGDIYTERIFTYNGKRYGNGKRVPRDLPPTIVTTCKNLKWAKIIIIQTCVWLYLLYYYLCII